MAICEDAPCCGCCGRNVYGSEVESYERAFEEDDFYWESGEDDEEEDESEEYYMWEDFGHLDWAGSED